MLTWKPTMEVIGAEPSATHRVCGAGNSRLPLMKQTGKSQLEPGASGA